MKKSDLTIDYKEFFSQKKGTISIIKVPDFKYIKIDGKGDPNDSQFMNAVQALYSVTYTLKFKVKKGEMSIDYKVMPLEGLWWAHDMNSFLNGSRDNWLWTVMIMQPDFINIPLFESAVKEVITKKGLPLAKNLRLEKYKAGRSAQILHTGSYSDERPTIEKLHKYIDDKGLQKSGMHQEIYLNDPNRTKPENLRTVIRQPVS